MDPLRSELGINRARTPSNELLTGREARTSLRSRFTAVSGRSMKFPQSGRFRVPGSWLQERFKAPSSVTTCIGQISYKVPSTRASVITVTIVLIIRRHSKPYTQSSGKKLWWRGSLHCGAEFAHLSRVNIICLAGIFDKYAYFYYTEFPCCYRRLPWTRSR